MPKMSQAVAAMTGAVDETIPIFYLDLDAGTEGTVGRFVRHRRDSDGLLGQEVRG